MAFTIQAEVFHQNSWFLVEDNDPKHTSKVVKKFMEENMPQKLLDWPSQSPVINPIENLFAWIKYQLNRLPHRRPTTVSALEFKLNQIWNGISPEFLKPYWRSMPKRCRMVVNNSAAVFNLFWLWTPMSISYILWIPSY